MADARCLVSDFVESLTDLGGHVDISAGERRPPLVHRSRAHERCGDTGAVPHPDQGQRTRRRAEAFGSGAQSVDDGA